MRLALLADIHGNHLALQAILKEARKQSVDELLVMGDIVGYYFHPDKVLECLEPWIKTMIRGNHEDSLKAAIASPETLDIYEKRYGSGLRMALDKLSDQQLDMLCFLPTQQKIIRDSYHILMCHGSPWDTDQYIYPNATDDVFERCFETGDDIVLSGHTHYSLLKKVNGALFVNPGSVGQPRDRKQGAAWALLDTDSGEINFRREHYDIDAVVSEAQLFHPDIPYLSEVLLRQ